MDRFVGTGSGCYNTQRRTVRASMSVPGTSSRSSPDRRKNGFNRSVLNKKSYNSEIGEMSEAFPNELVSQTFKSEFSTSLVIEKNNLNDSPIHRSPEIQAEKPAFVTFDNNSRFRIPILAEVHSKNNNSISPNKENIMMDNNASNPSISRHPTKQEV